jgi:ABC-2 type transport system permease protein
LRDGLRVAFATARFELRLFNRSRVIVVLAMLESITFLVLVGLFGLTGSLAPTALVDLDGGPLAATFIDHLRAAHNSFDLRPMTLAEAQRQLARGDLVAIITIPEDFSEDVAAGRTVVLPVTVDNVDADLTDDIREAVPSTITAFGRDLGFPGVRLVANERDLIDHDTGYVPYLVVSALVLDALVVAGILGAVSITREFEARTIVQWQLAPVSPSFVILGKLVAAALVAAAAVAVAAVIVIAGYGIRPRNIGELIVGLCLCVAIFTAIGACVGALLRRTLPVAALFFGLALPLYLDSGALEPLRFDGEVLWVLGHLSPVYSAIGVLQHGFHDLQVTPETLAQNFTVLGLWTVAGLTGAAALLSARFARR